MNPQSIFYPNSPNYLQLLGFSPASPFGYLPSTRTSNTVTTTVLLTPAQPIAYTPPPTGGSPTPNYVSTTSTTYSSTQIQGLLVQQTEAQNNLANTLTAYNNANNILNSLQSQAQPLNQQLKEASSYLNSTNAQLQKALADQSRGANQSLAITNIMTNLNNQLNNAQ